MFRAEIEGDETSLEIIRKNFEDYISVEVGKYYFTCPKFQRVSMIDIFSFAEEKLNHISCLLNLKHIKLGNVNLGVIENVKEDGKKEILAVVRGTHTEVKFSSHAHGFTDEELGENQVFDLHKVPEDLNYYLKCMDENNLIRDAVKYFNKEFNWVNLFKVYEIIDHDMGGKKGIVNQDWATDAEIDLFKCTAHNVRGAGEDARHAVESKINDRCRGVLSSHDPIELVTAISLVKKILSNWIEFKCL